jgi:hypothetical protein
LHSTTWSNGKTKRDGNHSPPKDNLIQDSEGNEKNEYPVMVSNKTKISNVKEHTDAHKNKLKEEILQVITENFMEILLDKLNQSIQEALETTILNNMKRHRNK